MNEYNVIFYLKNGKRQIFKDISHIEFYNEFVIVQDWNADCTTIETKTFDTMKIDVFYNALRSGGYQ